MLPVPVREIAEAVGGELLCGDENAVVTAVSTDSRAVAPGCLFLPWVGEKFDGHDFIGAALAAGAAGCLCARTPETLAEGKFYIRVQDTRLALKALASCYRESFPIPFIQVTGSVGKTTTKEMIAAVLSAKLRVLKTEANYNNDIGTPLTLLELDDTHEAAVIETGMNHAGEIRYLGEMVRPEIAVISNVGDAHIEFLGSRENILRAKCEIFENLRRFGCAVLNGDDALLRTVTLPQEILRCGTGEDCDVKVSDVTDLGVEGISCTVTTKKAAYPLEIPSPGAYMIYPAAMAVAVGEKLGLSPEEIVRGVRGYLPAGERMRVEKLAGGRVVLNDSYNANPQSMEAALRVLARSPGRRIAVLGDMGELGEHAERGHRAVGRLAGELGVELLFAVGEMSSRWMAPEARAAGCPDVRCFAEKTAAYPELTAAFVPGSVVLLKASHYSGRFDEIADYLRGCVF